METFLEQRAYNKFFILFALVPKIASTAKIRHLKNDIHSERRHVVFLSIMIIFKTKVSKLFAELFLDPLHYMHISFYLKLK